MPITVTFTEGTIDESQAQKAAQKITHLFLDLHQLSDNPVMAPGVTSHVVLLPRAFALSNGEPFEGAWIETRTPSFALNTPALKEQFFSGAADLIESLTQGRIKRENIFGSAIYAEDGSWILAGEPRSNEEILSMVSQA